QIRRAAALMQLGSAGAMPASSLMRSFRTDRARALFAGLAAHSTAPLSNPLTAAVGLAFGASAHAQGWPAVRGGSQKLVDALVAQLESHGGQIRTDFRVTGLHRVPQRRRGRKTHRRQSPWRVEGSAGLQEEVDVVVLDLTPA